MNLVQKFPGDIEVVQSDVWDKSWELECLECQWLVFIDCLVHCNGLKCTILWLDQTDYLGESKLFQQLLEAPVNCTSMGPNIELCVVISNILVYPVSSL